MTPRVKNHWVGFAFMILAALIASVSFPQVPVAWFLLIQALAYERFSLPWAILLSLLIGTLFASFSTAPLWLWLLPGPVALLLFEIWQRPFTQHPWGKRGGVLFFLWSAQTLLGLAWAWGRLSWWPWFLGQVLTLLLTLFMAWVVFPLLYGLGRELWSWLPKPRVKVREWNWLDHQEKNPWSGTPPRKPFGFRRTW